MALDARNKHRNHPKGNTKPSKRESKVVKGGVKKKPVSLKNQIRGIERLLRKEGLDARVRRKEQAKLQELQLALDQHKRAEKERTYAVRYHKVRFFERIKLERKLKKVERQLADARKNGGEAPAALLEHLACLQDDLQYVVHFPKGEKYVSILRDAEDPAAQAALVAERERLRALVHKQQAEIAMVTEADEGAALLARQRRPAQQLAAEHVAATAVPAEEAPNEDEDDFFTPDDSDVSASEGEQFHTAPRSSKPASSKPDPLAAQHRAAQGPGRAAAPLLAAPAGRPGPGGAEGPLAASVPGPNRADGAAGAAPFAVQTDGDIADDDDFFLQSGASDSEGESSEADADVAAGPGTPAVAGPRTHEPTGTGQRTSATVGISQRPAGHPRTEQQSRRGSGSQQGHGSWENFKRSDGGAPAKHGSGAGSKPRKALQRPGAATGKLGAPAKGPKIAGKRSIDLTAAKQPVRTRAEGGRKRRKAK